VLLIVGTGDYRWNIPQTTDMSVQMLDYLTVAAVAIFASGVTGLFETRRIVATVVVILAGVVAVTIAWWLIVQPVHTNDISWYMPAWMAIGLGLTIAISTLTVARTLRASERSADHA
jgi:hypothetical protein